MQTEQPQCGEETADGGSFSPPSLACDCHAHVFGPHARYPMVAGRAYTPKEAMVREYGQFLKAMGVGRAVLVQPSIYGIDNSCQLEALPEFGIEARAVVALGSNADFLTVERFHRRGARGARANLLVGSGLGWSELVELVDHLAPLGWHLDVQLDHRVLETKEDTIRGLPLPVVLDHFANWRPTASRQETRSLLRFLELENVWIKLSSIHRLSLSGPPYDDMADFARQVIALAPDRVLWGSDWPFPLHAGPQVDASLVLASVMEWCGGDQARQQLLVDNPSRLFGFESSPPATAESTEPTDNRTVEYDHS